MKKISVLFVGVLIVCAMFALSGCSVLLSGLLGAGESSQASSDAAKNVLVTSDDGSISMSVPGDWDATDTSLTKGAVIGVSNGAKEQYVVVLEESKANFADDFTTSDYMAIIQKGMDSKVTNPVWGNTSSVKIGDFDAVTAQLSGTYDKLNVVYWVYVVEGASNFYQVDGWTLKTMADANKPVISGVIGTLKQTD